MRTPASASALRSACSYHHAGSATAVRMVAALPRRGNRPLT
jgi:hypothetical protein